MTPITRIGLIGAGRWGRNYIKAIESLDVVSLVRLASSNPQAEALVLRDCLVSADWRDVASDTGLDGVIIATPPVTHAAITLMALEHRLGVLVEKPLTLRIEDAERIRAQAETAGVPVLVNHTHLFSSAFAKLLELVPDLGNIRRLSGRAGNHGPYRPDVPVLWDWGPHDLAMCLAITGSSPQSVTAECLERKTVGDATAENLRIDLGFEDGVTADIVLSTLDPKCRRFAVFGDNGAALYDDLAPNKLTRFAPGVDVFSVAGRSGVPVPVEAEPPLSRAVRTFAEQLGESAFDPKNLDLAVEVVRVLEMCEASLNG